MSRIGIHVEEVFHNAPKLFMRYFLWKLLIITLLVLHSIFMWSASTYSWSDVLLAQAGLATMLFSIAFKDIYPRRSEMMKILNSPVCLQELRWMLTGQEWIEHYESLAQVRWLHARIKQEKNGNRLKDIRYFG